MCSFWPIIDLWAYSIKGCIKTAYFQPDIHKVNKENIRKICHVLFPDDNLNQVRFDRQIFWQNKTFCVIFAVIEATSLRPLEPRYVMLFCAPVASDILLSPIFYIVWKLWSGEHSWGAGTINFRFTFKSKWIYDEKNTKFGLHRKNKTASPYSFSSVFIVI